jgi:replicative DNA helicase
VESELEGVSIVTGNARDLALEKGLPANLDAERFVLGAVLLDDTAFPTVAAALEPEDFSLEKHRRIFLRMTELHERSERIDRVTLANELRAHNQLESVDGFGYLVSLDEGLPALAHFESYIRIVREKSRRRHLIFAAQRLIDYAIDDTDVTARELAAECSQEFARIANTDSENNLTSVGEIIDEERGGLARFIERGASQRPGLQTGFERFDEMTGGLQRGDLIVLAGRPSMGKTALALNVAAHAAAGPQGLSVALFSLEMSRESQITRILCSAARVDMAKQRAGFLNQHERARMSSAAEHLRAARLFIDDSASLNVMDIHAKLRRLRVESGVDLAIIDYLGLIASHRKIENRVRELGEITRYLKLMVARELDIPVVLLSQLSRACETRPGDHRPILSDLRESGDIEQDADLVAFIYREEVYKPDDERLRGLAELLIAKQRNGPIGRVNLIFLKEFMHFDTRASFADEPMGAE